MHWRLGSQCGIVGDGGTFERWGLVEGFKIIGMLSSKGNIGVLEKVVTRANSYESLSPVSELLSGSQFSDAVPLLTHAPATCHEVLARAELVPVPDP